MGTYIFIIYIVINQVEVALYHLIPLARSIHYRAIEYRQLDTIHIRFNTSIIDIACAAVEFTSKLQLARNARTSLSLRAEATSMSS